ncbi:MAG: hypothetical protein ACOX5W_02680 [Bacillota bacterium]
MQSYIRERATPAVLVLDAYPKKSWFGQFMLAVLGILLLAAAISLIVPTAALAASDSLEITGDGVTTPMTLTLEDLEKWSSTRRYIAVLTPGLPRNGM